MVYELNKDGYFYALDVDTGDLVWKYQGPGSLLWPGSPTVVDGKIYATTGQAAQYGGIESISEFACLNAYTGQLLWKLPIEAFAPRESVAVAYGRLYLIPGNVTTAVDSVSGSEYTTINQVWAIGASSPLVDSSPWSMFRKDAAHSSIAYGGPSNLTFAWNFTTGGAVISSPSVSDGIVYVGSQDKYLYALGAWSGNLIWKFKTLGTIESSQAEMTATFTVLTLTRELSFGKRLPMGRRNLPMGQQCFSFLPQPLSETKSTLGRLTVTCTLLMLTMVMLSGVSKLKDPSCLRQL
jgi:hypothetical protein